MLLDALRLVAMVNPMGSLCQAKPQPPWMLVALISLCGHAGRCGTTIPAVAQGMDMEKGKNIPEGILGCQEANAEPVLIHWGCWGQKRMRWISLTGLCRVELSSSPSLWSLVGQHMVSQGPDMGEAGSGGLSHYPIVDVMWGEGETGGFECLLL